MKEDKKPTIAKIVIDLGKSKLELSPAQAKELHAILDEMYGKDEKVVYREWWTQPRWYPSHYSQWYVTYGDGTIMAGGASGLLSTSSSGDSCCASQVNIDPTVLTLTAT